MDTNIHHKLKIKYSRIYNVALKFWHVGGLAFIKKINASIEEANSHSGMYSQWKEKNSFIKSSKFISMLPIPLFFVPK
jgi:hypothetical protein